MWKGEEIKMGIVKKGWLLLGVLSLLGCTSKVELNIYSGREDPTWMLTLPEVSNLKNMISKLDQTEEICKCHDNLGYRGFTVQTPTASSDYVQTIRACHGQVIVEDSIGEEPIRTVYYLDPQRQIELWLLTTAKPPFSHDEYVELVNIILESNP
jgi:hypothetical protein